MAEGISNINKLKWLSYGLNSQQNIQYGITALKYILAANAIYQFVRLRLTQTLFNAAGCVALNYCQEGMYHKAADERLTIIGSVLETTGQQLEQQKHITEQQKEALEDTKKQLESQIKLAEEQKLLVKEQQNILEKLKEFDGMSQEDIEKRKLQTEEQQKLLDTLNDQLKKLQDDIKTQQALYDKFKTLAEEQQRTHELFKKLFESKIEQTATELRGTQLQMSRSVSDLQQHFSPHGSPQRPSRLSGSQSFDPDRTDTESATTDHQLAQPNVTGGDYTLPFRQFSAPPFSASSSTYESAQIPLHRLSPSPSNLSVSSNFELSKNARAPSEEMKITSNERQFALEKQKELEKKQIEKQ